MANGGGTNQNARSRRRAELRRNLPRPAYDIRSVITRPQFVKSSLVLLGFALLATTIIVWSREQVVVRPGQVMSTTALKRVDYRELDEAATEAARESARVGAPLVYRLNTATLEDLENALLNLPKVVANRTETAGLPAELIAEFGLTDRGVVALNEFMVEGEPTQQWKDWVDDLVHVRLRVNPLLASHEYSGFMMKPRRELILPDTPRPVPILGEATELRPEMPALEGRLRDLVDRAGFAEPVIPYVVARLRNKPNATIIFDEQYTDEQAEKLASAVAPVMIDHKAGEILYRRGDRLTADQFRIVLNETHHFRLQASATVRWLPRLGILGICMLLIALTAIVTWGNYPRLTGRTLRVVALTGLTSLMLFLGAFAAVRSPTLMYIAAAGPTLFVVLVVLLAYDQRFAAIIAVLQCALAALAMQQGVGWFSLMLVGCGAMIVQLREVRHRNSLIRSAAITAIVVGVGTILLGFAEMPAVSGTWTATLSNAGWAAAGSFGVGFVVLGLLPSIERVFDITTGMTLAELRDPRQPLLRQLQQKAPGTYNHSLQVANIAEAAAEAIGADGLLIYVGSMYHDIGKLNKPEYFVENQADGYNKHDKLSPAMSLLVIIGHVKDGVELAREYGLPRRLIHFIESHHGTTLVEYFFHAARTAAETDEKRSVSEVEFRYPGPKPRTREAAIVMLADAVESATRAMAEPNPARIESLVREISRKRLTDGQFDRCPLTFRELGLIEDAIIGRLCAIHHGRISYPTAKTDEVEAEAKPA